PAPGPDIAKERAGDERRIARRRATVGVERSLRSAAADEGEVTAAPLAFDEQTVRDHAAVVPALEPVRKGAVAEAGEIDDIAEAVVRFGGDVVKVRTDERMPRRDLTGQLSFVTLVVLNVEEGDVRGRR